MGKKKIEHVALIDDKVSRNVTFCKRKKGLIKKAMEMSLLCGQQVAVHIYDSVKSKLVIYQSTPDFDIRRISSLVESPIANNGMFELYTNEHYQSLSDSKVVTA